MKHRLFNIISALSLVLSLTIFSVWLVTMWGYSGKATGKPTDPVASFKEFADKVYPNILAIKHNKLDPDDVKWAMEQGITPRRFLLSPSCSIDVRKMDSLMYPSYEGSITWAMRSADTVPPWNEPWNITAVYAESKRGWVLVRCLYNGRAEYRPYSYVVRASEQAQQTLDAARSHK